MEFEEGVEVWFTLRGADLVVRRERRRWHLCWHGHEADAEHVDRAVAALLNQPVSSVMPIVARLLRAQPGESIG